MFNPDKPEIDQTHFPAEDWSTNPYGPCEEDCPSNAPVPRFISVTMIAFVYSDHFVDSISRRSRTSCIVLLNSNPIFVCSKKKGSCEKLNFGSESIAMKS